MDDILIYIAVLLAGCLAVLVCLLLNPGQRLVVAAALIMPQLYIPGVPLAVADVWLIVMAAVALIDTRIKIPPFSAVYLVFLVCIAYIVAFLWSPNIVDGAVSSLRIFIYGVLICYAYSVAVLLPSYLRIALRWVTPWIVLHAVMTFAFRLNVSWETSFLRSWIGHLLIGPAARDLFTVHANNVLDPLKAGGLFVNGNVASMFGGVAAFLLFAAARYGWSKWYYVWSALALASTIAAGSKTGLALAIVLPLVSVVLSRATNARTRFMLIPLAVIIAPVTIALPSLIEEAFPSFSERSLSSYGTRIQIWHVAARLLNDSPILGLGHGGWAALTAGIPGVNGYPPHNIIIATWSTAGAFGAIAVISLIVATTVWNISSVLNAKDKPSRTAAACLLSGFLWIYLHGMGDNTTLYGESRTMILAIMMFGLAFLIAPPSRNAPGEGLVSPTKQPLGHH